MFKLGEDMGFKPGAKLKYMALGQGMGPKAAEFIEMGVTRGLWIMLQVKKKGLQLHVLHAQSLRCNWCMQSVCVYVCVHSACPCAEQSTLGAD